MDKLGIPVHPYQARCKPMTRDASASEIEKLASAFTMEYLTGHYRPLRDDEQRSFDQLRVVMLAFASQVRRLTIAVPDSASEIARLIEEMHEWVIGPEGRPTKPCSLYIDNGYDGHGCQQCDWSEISHDVWNWAERLALLTTREAHQQQEQSTVQHLLRELKPGCCCAVCEVLRESIE